MTNVIVNNLHDWLHCSKSSAMQQRTKIIERSSGLYFVGFIGAVVYYLQHATNFGDGLLGFLKAMVWPAFLVYKAMDFLKM